MALRRKLLDTLNDKNEPLSKRLKLADNALKYPDLPIQHKEAYLLQWLETALKTNSVDVWATFYSWLTSSYFTDITRNDITSEDLKRLSKLLRKRFEAYGRLDGEVQQFLVKCTISVLENKTFQQFYKYDLEDYCLVISSFIDNVDEKDFQMIISNECIYHKYVILDGGFHSAFLGSGINSLVRCAVKYSTNLPLYEAIVTVLQRCLFLKHFKPFELHIKHIFDDEAVDEQNLISFPKNVLRILYTSYNNESCSKYFYKLVFNAFLMSFRDSTLLVYKYFIVLLHSLGFKVKHKFNMTIKKSKLENPNINKSVEIVSELFAVLSLYKLDLECKVNEISFRDFLTNLINDLLNITDNCDVNLLRLLNFASDINPLVVETLLTSIGSHAILYNDPNQLDVQTEYEKLTVNMFNTFAKLHRIQKLVAVLLNVLHESLFCTTVKESIENAETSIGFIGDTSVPCKNRTVTTNIHIVMPSKLLKCFGEHVQSLPTSQIYNLWKSLLHHLEISVDQDLHNVAELNEKKILFLQIVAALMCEMMENVRVAEHTILGSVVEKFIRGLKDLGTVLGRFGIALMNMEHNQSLMFSLLNLCFLWGELTSNLIYYRTEAADKFERKLDANYSACNITYLHSYLTSEQWSLIMQRITNFGEKPCKQLMQKLCIQRWKAIVLFEDNVPEEISKAVLKTVGLHFDETWEQFVEDPFCINVLLPQLEGAPIQKLDEFYLKNVDTKDSVESSCFDYVKDSKVFSISVLYKCLSKIHALFRSRKSLSAKTKDGNADCFALNAVSSVTFDDFLKEDLESVTDEFMNIFCADFSLDEVKIGSKFNFSALTKYLRAIQRLPVVFLSDSAKELLFWFILALRINLATVTIEDSSITQKCEDILLGILNNCSKLGLIGKLPLDKQIALINSYTYKCTEIYSVLIHNYMKQEENVPKLKCGVKYICANLYSDAKVLNFALIFTSAVAKNKKNSFSAENKTQLAKYYNRICKSIVGLIADEESLSNGLIVEAYAFTLQKYLKKDTRNQLPVLLERLERITALAKENISNGRNVKGSLMLFAALLRNRSKIENIPDDFVEQVWDKCKNPQDFPKNQEEYSRVLTILFERMSIEQFSKVVGNMLENTLHSLKNSDESSACSNIGVWKHILSSNFNAQKTALLLENLQILFQKILLYLQENPESTLLGVVIPLTRDIVYTVQLRISSPIVDSCLCFVTIVAAKLRNPSTDKETFSSTFSSCISILTGLLKFRKAQIMDRLPPFLQRYRFLLTSLCLKNGDRAASVKDIQELADCAHLLEKLTKLLVTCPRDMSRIAPYLIADILKEYEQVALYPNVKIHLNNCLYSLLSLCDQHSVSYLLRVLSTASTEIFKVTYEHYKKHYRFTGRI